MQTTDPERNAADGGPAEDHARGKDAEKSDERLRLQEVEERVHHVVEESRYVVAES
jgi:hypothetical protein